MTHALAFGSDVETVGTHGLVCDGCGFVTYVAISDEDAVWVLCDGCRRTEGM